MAHNNNSRGGMSFLGVLGLIFIVLKLTHVIDWSWWLVLLPLYGGLVLILPFLIGFIIYKIVKRSK